METSRNPTYVLRWHRRLFWHRITDVIKHLYDSNQDKLIVFRAPDGASQEICGWSRCTARLGKDWVEAMRAQAQAGAIAKGPLTPGVPQLRVPLAPTVMAPPPGPAAPT